MKKYIFILLSFGLFLLPLGALARVNAEYCADDDFDGENCPPGCVGVRGSSEEDCIPCPKGTYSSTNATVGYCSACNKPADADWEDYADNVGATNIKKE